MSPKRVQRKRSKGWRMPENTLYVGRGSSWGNQYRVVPQHKSGPFDIYGYYGESREVFVGQSTGIESARGIARDRFRKWLENQTEMYLDGYFRQLRGKNLACWCPIDQPCHADILLELANSGQAD